MSRTSDGRFAEGNPGGPGRPKRATEAEYLDALSEVVTPTAWRAVVERALADAIAGDARARDWLSRHLIGDVRPVDAEPGVILIQQHADWYGQPPEPREAG